jgi:hypothetical protein
VGSRWTTYVMYVSSGHAWILLNLRHAQDSCLFSLYPCIAMLDMHALQSVIIDLMPMRPHASMRGTLIGFSRAPLTLPPHAVFDLHGPGPDLSG